MGREGVSIKKDKQKNPTNSPNPHLRCAVHSIAWEYSFANQPKVGCKWLMGKDKGNTTACKETEVWEHVFSGKSKSFKRTGTKGVIVGRDDTENVGKGQVMKSLAWVLRRYILYSSDGCFSDISSVKGKKFSQILSWFQFSLNIMAETVYNSLIFILPTFLLVDRTPQILPRAYIFQPPLQLSMVTWPCSGQWEVSGEEGLQLLCPVLMRKLLALYFLSTPSHRLEIQRSGDKPAPTPRMKAILLDLTPHTWSVRPASPGSLWKCRSSARTTPTEADSAVK